MPRVFSEEIEAFELASRCGKVQVESHDREPGPVTRHRTYGRVPTDLRFVRPFKTVKVSPASKIEFLEGCRQYSETYTGQYVVWVRVKVDGEEGWVSAEGADLDTLGLPQAD